MIEPQIRYQLLQLQSRSHRFNFFLIRIYVAGSGRKNLVTVQKNLVTVQTHEIFLSIVTLFRVNKRGSLVVRV
jgi:hypothetical protein